MHLTPREQERLQLFTLAELARRRRSRGSLLGAPDAIALICDEVLEAAWDGASLNEVVELGRSVLSADDVLDGVPALVPQVQVEALFPNGSALVAIADPLGAPPVNGPGAIRTPGGEVELHAGRVRETLRARNGSDRKIVVSSHFPLEEVNEALEFDRVRAGGARLDIPAGTALAFAPGEERDLPVVFPASQEPSAPLDEESR